MVEATGAGAGRTDGGEIAAAEPGGPAPDGSAPGGPAPGGPAPDGLTPGGPAPGWETLPGGPTAVERGCECSVLANAAFRARAEPEPLIDPRCPLHTAS